MGRNDYDDLRGIINELWGLDDKSGKDDRTEKWMLNGMGKLLCREIESDGAGKVVAGYKLDADESKRLGGRVTMLQQIFQARHGGIVTCTTRGVATTDEAGGIQRVDDVVVLPMSRLVSVAAALNALHDRSVRGRWTMDCASGMLYMEDYVVLNGDSLNDTLMMRLLHDFCTHEFMRCLPMIVHASEMSPEKASDYIRTTKFDDSPEVEMPMATPDDINRLNDEWYEKHGEVDDE